MTAIEFLQQPLLIDKRIRNKLAEKEQWKSVAFGVVANNDSERVQSSGSQQKMADAVARFIDIEKEIDEEIDRLVDIKKDVLKVIEQLKPNEYDVLHKRYIQGMTPDEIVYEVQKSKSWVKAYHKKALRNVQNILDERENIT